MTPNKAIAILAVLALAILCMIGAPHSPAAPRMSAKILAAPLCPGYITTPLCITLSWNPSTSQATCLSTNPTPCTNFGYNIFEGSSSGGESTTPVNGAALITSTTYSVPVTLGSSATVEWFTVGAQESLNGVPIGNPAPNPEISVSLPAGVQAATGFAGALE